MQITDVEIHQMMPADGWLAVTDMDQEPYFLVTRVIAWALVSRRESPDHTMICALAGASSFGGTEIAPVDEDDVITYIHERDLRPEEALTWSALGRSRYEPADPEITPESGQ